MMGGVGVIILPLSLSIIGILGGFVIAKVAQKASPQISNNNVVAITQGWAISLTLGGASASIFFAYALANTLTWNYLTTGLFMTIGFAIVGIFAGFVGARKMFREIRSATLSSM